MMQLSALTMGVPYSTRDPGNDECRDNPAGYVTRRMTVLNDGIAADSAASLGRYWEPNVWMITGL
jgi:hypothetical protein